MSRSSPEGRSVGYGFGWRLAAFDGLTRAGVVALGDERLAFDAAAAGDEELEVGGEVFVRLLSVGGGKHVARVWPCLAQLRAPPAAPGPPHKVPTPDPSADRRLASLLGEIPAPFVALVTTEPGRAVSVTAGCAWRNAYGLAGWDVTFHGELHCTDAYATETGVVRVACARLASERERASLHASGGLRAGDVALALSERRGDLDPAADARLVLVAARAVSWQPPPARERLAAVEAVLREARATSVRVSSRELLALAGEEVAARVPLTSEGEACAMAAWCRFVAPILRGDEIDWEPP